MADDNKSIADDNKIMADDNKSIAVEVEGSDSSLSSLSLGEESPLESGHGDSPLGVEPVGMEPERRVLTCKFCERQFSTMQALGGHQKAHRKERAAQKLEKARPFLEYLHQIQSGALGPVPPGLVLLNDSFILNGRVPLPQLPPGRRYYEWLSPPEVQADAALESLQADPVMFQRPEEGGSSAATDASEQQVEETLDHVGTDPVPEEEEEEEENSEIDLTLKL